MASKIDKKSAASIFGMCVLLLAFASFGKAQRPDWNIIRGTVVDQANVPVEGAEVCIPDPVHGDTCSKSTQDGRFSIHVDRAGTYYLAAKCEEKGYPNFWFAPFYGKLLRIVPVTITDNSSPEPVTIVLGPQAGRLIVTIIDDATGKPIDKGQVAQCRVEEPKSCWSVMPGDFPNGRYELLTPEVPFTIKFSTWEGTLVNGKWVNGKWIERKAFDIKSGLPVEVLQVDLGARKEITVRLF